MLPQPNTNRTEDVWIKSVCNMCQACDAGIRAHRVNGVLVEFKGDPECPPTYGRLCAKGSSAVMMPYNPKRVLQPLKRTNQEKGLGLDPKWVTISWEEAVDEIVTRMKRIHEENPLKLLLSTFDYPSYLFVGPWLRAFGGQFWFGGSTWCGWVHWTCYQYLGSFFREADYDHCNYLILWGTQSGHLVDVLPVLSAKKLADARTRGIRVIAIDPVCTNAASKADEWIPIRPGTDAALALAFHNLLINEYGTYDVNFLKRYTNGPYLIGAEGYYARDGRTGNPLVWDAREERAKPYDAVDPEDMALEGVFEAEDVKLTPSFSLFKEHVKKYTPERVSEITSVPTGTIRRIAKEFGEVAKIGSKIVIGEAELPYRPACVLTGRGASAHRHALHTVYAMELLNVMIGATNVPGGALGISTLYERRWGPRVDKDGMFLSSNWYWKFCLDPYPRRRAAPPKLYNLIELCPTAVYSDNFVPLVMKDPRRFRIPYDIEMMFISHVNPVMGLANPEEIVELLRKVPFICGFATELNEAMEMCDIVIPDAHWTERYDPIANPPFKFVAVGRDDWYWFFRRPILQPPAGVRHWVEVLFELAERTGFLKEFYKMLNWYNELRGENRLDPDGKYTFMEVCDRILKDRYGVGVEWFEENKTQHLTQKKSVREAYPRPFTEGRVPIYLEDWKHAGEEVSEVVKELGIGDLWDTDDYRPLLDWKPCLSYKAGGDYDLFAVNYKVPTHTFSYTLSNPLLKEIGQTCPWAYGVQVNSATAKRKGIKDGDKVWIEAENGHRVKGTAVVTETIHPECIGIAGTFGKKAFGETVAKGMGVHWNTLISLRDPERFDKATSSIDSCIRVRVWKA